MWKSWTEDGGSGAANRRPQRVPDYVVVAEVTRPHGVAGEVKVRPVDTAPGRLSSLDVVYCAPPARRRGRRGPAGEGGEGARRRLEVRRVRLVQDGAIIAFHGVDTRDEAEKLRGCLLEVPGSQVEPLPEGRYYVFELVGCRVETVAGAPVGELVDVLHTGANDVYVVEDGAGRQVLIPAIREMVKDIDVERQRIVIDPWPGLLPEDGEGGGA